MCLHENWKARMMCRRKLTRGSRLASSALLWNVMGALGVIGGCSGGQGPQNRGAESVFPIVVAQEDLDLGAIWATTDYSWTLHLENTSPREVELAELRASCKCLSVEPSPVTIPAKQQSEVTLRLDVSTAPDDNAKVKEPSFPLCPIAIALISALVL